MNGEQTQLHPSAAMHQESQGDSLPMQIDHQHGAAPHSPADNGGSAEQIRHSDTGHGHQGSEQGPALVLEDTQEHVEHMPALGSQEAAPTPAGRFAELQNDTYDEFAGIE